MCVCVRACVCECVLERDYVHDCVCQCVYRCVCVRERKRERERGGLDQPQRSISSAVFHSTWQWLRTRTFGVMSPVLHFPRKHGVDFNSKTILKRSVQIAQEAVTVSKKHHLLRVFLLRIIVVSPSQNIRGTISNTDWQTDSVKLKRLRVCVCILSVFV